MFHRILEDCYEMSAYDCTPGGSIMSGRSESNRRTKVQPLSKKMMIEAQSGQQFTPPPSSLETVLLFLDIMIGLVSV